jgi:Insect cuticle protein
MKETDLKSKTNLVLTKFLFLSSSKIVLSALVALSAAQGYNRDPKTAAIISEQRYLSGNGQFGAAYTQEDGTDFKEETDEQGNRRGSYSYVDPDGQKRTVNYVAGKNG